MINSVIAFNTKWFKIVKNTVKLPEKTVIVDDFYVFEANDSAMIVAIDTDNNIIMKQEYRFPVDEVLLELPAGGFNDEEKDPLMVAKRELLEETGYVSENWMLLAHTYDCPNRCNNGLYLFLARDSVKISKQDLDITESIDVVPVPFGEALSMCNDGRIKVNSCVHAIMKAAAVIQSEKDN